MTPNDIALAQCDDHLQPLTHLPSLTIRPIGDIDMTKQAPRTNHPPSSATTSAPSPSGVQKMTPSEAFVETMVANGVTDMFGIMGSAFMDAMDIFAPAGIRLIPVVHEQGAGAHGRRLCPRLGPPRRGDRPERPRHQQLRDRDRRGLLGAQPGGHRHARDRHDGHGPRRLPGSQPAADVPGVHQVPGPREQPEAHGRVHRPLLRPRDVRDGPDAAQHSARLLLRRDHLRDPEAACALDRGAGGEKSLERGGRAARARPSSR